MACRPLSPFIPLQYYLHGSGFCKVAGHFSSTQFGCAVSECNAAFHSLCPTGSLQEVSVQSLCESVMGWCFGGCVLSGGLFHSLFSSRQWIVYSTSAECTVLSRRIHWPSVQSSCSVQGWGARTTFTLLWILDMVLASGNHHKLLNCPQYFRFCLNSSRGSKYKFLLGNGIRCAGAVHPNSMINMGTVIPERQRNPISHSQLTVYQSLRNYVPIFT